jgi:hypothetical protein
MYGVPISKADLKGKPPGYFSAARLALNFAPGHQEKSKTHGLET